MANSFTNPHGNRHLKQFVYCSILCILDRRKSNKRFVREKVTSETSTFSLYFANPVTTLLTFLLPPVSSNAQYVFLDWRQKGSNNTRTGSYWLLSRFVYTLDPKKGTEIGRNWRTRDARSGREKELVGVAASQWAHLIRSRGVYILYSSHVQRPHVCLTEHTAPTLQHFLSHVPRERRKVERGLIVCREVKKFFRVF